MLVKVQPFRKKNDANSAPVKIDNQYLCGEITGESDPNVTVTLPLGK
jgi:hypothetical protein